MAVLVVPSLMRKLTGGKGSFESEGSDVGDLIDALDRVFPGVRDRLVEDGSLRPGLAVAVDGEISHRGMAARIGAESTVRLLPAVKGG